MYVQIFNNNKPVLGDVRHSMVFVLHSLSRMDIDTNVLDANPIRVHVCVCVCLSMIQTIEKKKKPRIIPISCVAELVER